MVKSRLLYHEPNKSGPVVKSSVSLTMRWDYEHLLHGAGAKIKWDKSIKWPPESYYFMTMPYTSKVFLQKFPKSIYLVEWSLLLPDWLGVLCFMSLLQTRRDKGAGLCHVVTQRMSTEEKSAWDNLWAKCLLWLSYFRNSSSNSGR
jgi:hypothetical protein